MKMVLFLSAFVLAAIIFLMALVNDAFGEEVAQKTAATSSENHIVRIAGEEGKDTEMVLSSPGEGKTLTVIVDVPVRKKPATVTNITHVRTGGSNLQLRWGVGMNILMLLGAVPELTAVTGGLVGEIGYSDSPWRLQGRANLGKCQDNYLAVGGELAALRRLTKRFWVGGGGAVLYCADTDAHPRELGKKRLIGAAAKMVYEEKYTHSAVAVELSLGLDIETVPVPGSRDNDMAGNIGLSVSYLF